MARITSSKPFLFIILVSLVTLSIIERIKIGLPATLWHIVIVFPLIHLTLHAFYLLKIHFVKQRHLTVILCSHLSYCLLFLFQYNIVNGRAEVVLFELVKSYSPSLSVWLTHTALPYLQVIFIAVLALYIISEALFFIYIKKYITTEAIVIYKGPEPWYKMRSRKTE